MLFRETADQNDDELDYCLLLQQIRDTIDDDHSIQFNINRLKIFDGAVRAIKRKTFCDHPMGRLDIKFSDSFGSPESAIDVGGPTREFLRLLTSAVMQSPVFEGPANARILTRNETGELNNFSNCRYLAKKKCSIDVLSRFLVFGRCLLVLIR